ncbi:ATP-binding protein [Streptomyces sp. DG2A-72]|uniref:ATP-binding protein n=1 Tax=Streptomyces sp. DG2A-72 TaxID=3051386 RepID=UPI00265BF302|nr:ATP-binding protein [Streptomyces sp. DG2A-72]MDO0938913.1 ATP-binding protein [Streptomyces sp. DG2A-72]
MTAPRAQRHKPSPSPAHIPQADRAPLGQPHPTVIPVNRPSRLHTTIPAQPSRAADVRHMVTEHLRQLRLPPEYVDNAVLATDELFANAVQHARSGPGGTVTLTIECGESELRVTVGDQSPLLPRLRTAGGAEESGRGLAIVAALADGWGVAPPEPGSPGKRVWFTLELGWVP